MANIRYTVEFHDIADFEDFASMAARYLAARRKPKPAPRKRTARPSAPAKAESAEAIARALLALVSRP